MEADYSSPWTTFPSITTSRIRLSQLRGWLLVTGLCGGFTTFSTFSADTVRLLRAGDYTPAVCYVVLSIAVCLLFTALGMLLGSQTRTA